MRGEGHHLLLLAGSGEARDIAAALGTGPLRVTASLYAPEHWSGALPLPTRTGGFGGAAGFLRFLEDEGITAVLDATHPFAARVSARSWMLCRERSLPFCQVDRPDWTAGPGDRWTAVDTMEQAVQLTQPGMRVFVTTGRESLPAFESVRDRQFYVRRLTDQPVVSGQAHITFVPGLGPFSVAEERATFERLGIDCLICKNAGGSLSRTKLEAARALGLPVILLNRPPASGAPRVRTVQAALDWVAQTCV